MTFPDIRRFPLTTACLGTIGVAILCGAAVARAQPAADPTFLPGANGEVLTLAVQPNGKILVGGNFSMLGGWPSRSLARLNSDGSLDTSFDAGTNGTVECLAVQKDGSILVGGFFSKLGRGGAGMTARNNIGRLNADGSVDPNFNPDADDGISALALQANEGILVGGHFTKLGNNPRKHLGRINPDGSVDSLNPGTDFVPRALAVQLNGDIVVGGSFTTLAGAMQLGIGRLRALDGSLDTTFNPFVLGTVWTLAVQPGDDKILVGGEFTTLAGATRSHIGRLLSSGAVDTSFYNVAGGPVYAMAVQADGKVIVGGAFSSIYASGVTSLSGIARLNANGTPDVSFSAGAVGTVRALALQRDGQLLAGGRFSWLGGLGGPRTASPSRVGRLTGTGPVSENLTIDFRPPTPGLGLHTIDWIRGGTAPELDRVTFESSTDGVTFASLGDGRPVGGSEWLLTTKTLPVNVNLSIRARAHYGKGSGSIVESVVSGVRIPP